MQVEFSIAISQRGSSYNALDLIFAQRVHW
jgi:hypothetical protein